MKRLLEELPNTAHTPSRTWRESHSRQEACLPRRDDWMNGILRNQRGYIAMFSLVLVVGIVMVLITIQAFLVRMQLNA